jgi:hypothetical protein
MSQLLEPGICFRAAVWVRKAVCVLGYRNLVDAQLGERELEHSSMKAATEMRRMKRLVRVSFSPDSLDFALVPSFSPVHSTSNSSKTLTRLHRSQLALSLPLGSLLIIQ